MVTQSKANGPLPTSYTPRLSKFLRNKFHAPNEWLRLSLDISQSARAEVVAQTSKSAVSRVSNPLAVRHGKGRSDSLPIGNRRYNRLETCATSVRRTRAPLRL